MESEKLTEKLLQYIDHDLSIDEMQNMAEWIEADTEIKKEYLQLKTMQQSIDRSVVEIPSAKMTHRFKSWLANQSIQQTKTIERRISFWKIAAAFAFLIVSGAIAWSAFSYLKQREELSIVKKELEETKQLVLVQIQNPLSASSRITAVQASLKMDQLDDEIIHVLTKTINEDPSSNVRIAALEAMSNFYHLPAVRKALLECMKYQKDPVVQITLIQLLVQMKEKTIVPDLQKIIDQPGMMKAVRDEAYSGIFKLT
ncbi:MAG: HEAT repeat domain-containing protein [Saprospiraceae bacterium]